MLLGMCGVYGQDRNLNVHLDMLLSFCTSNVSPRPEVPGSKIPLGSFHLSLSPSLLTH